jgi:vanillate O-demethylase monooxygenase subunit
MHYVRNAWYVAAWSHDIGDRKPFAIAILGEPVVIYRSEAGRLIALEDRCVHRMAPLSLGRCEGERLRCMYHGLLFDPDGKVAEIPGQDIIPHQARVKSYAVTEKHSWIWVWMGDADSADESLIPPAVGFDHPDFILGSGHLDYAAEARLINDNLLDFSHLTYVHANSFGATDTWARNRPVITPLARGVRFERWITGEVGMRGRDDGALHDRWTSYDFLIPGVLLMTGGYFEPGTAAKCDHQAPDLDDALGGITFTSQAVTPMQAKTSRYFFSWGPHRRHGDEAQRDALMKLADMAFGEDKVMIEAQQRVIDATPDPRIMPTSADKGVTLFNRLIEKLVRAEQDALRNAA